MCCCSGAVSVTSAGGTFAFALSAFSGGVAPGTRSERCANAAVHMLGVHRIERRTQGDDMTTSATTTAPYAELAAAMRGDLIMPGDPGFDQARAVYNAMIDKHPAAIARCRDTADVITCVRFARSTAPRLRSAGAATTPPASGWGRRPGHRPVAAAPHHGPPAGPHRTRRRRGYLG